MITDRVEFPNSTGQNLSGILEKPSGEAPVAFALFAHCFTCSKDYKSVFHSGRAMVERGYAVLRFDFTGLGESEGDFADTSFFSNVEDLISAADFLARNYEGPKLLVGHSLGGAAVLQAAGRIHSSTAVATIAAPSSPKNLVRLAGDRRVELERAGSIEVNVGARPFRIGKKFFDALELTSMDDTIRELGRALLVLHSPADKVVDIENAARIFERAQHPKSFVSLGAADHLLSNPKDGRYAGEVISAWAGRYVGV